MYSIKYRMIEGIVMKKKLTFAFLILIGDLITILMYVALNNAEIEPLIIKTKAK